MTTPNIFPLHYSCSDTHGWADSPALAKRLWLRLRQTVAPDLVWYAVAMRIDSASRVKLFVYDMANAVHGGIGNQVLAHEVARAAMTPDECAMLDDLIIKAMTEYAEYELQKRMHAERQAQILTLRHELFGR